MKAHVPAVYYNVFLIPLNQDNSPSPSYLSTIACRISCSFSWVRVTCSSEGMT